MIRIAVKVFLYAPAPVSLRERRGGYCVLNTCECISYLWVRFGVCPGLDVEDRDDESEKGGDQRCLGAVIRGSTSHYDYVCNEVSKGIATVSLESGVPVLFGVLTTENIEQAIERAGTKAGNKGYDCAVSAIEMVNLLREMDTAAE